jgi:phosphatidate cytidylyltransferase
VSPLDWVVCAGIVGLTGTVGDLLESAFKRARGVKDSGRVLPGHGGILDRFDGFLIALPAVYAWLFLPR